MQTCFFAQPSRHWAAGHGSCTHNSVEQHGWWQSLTKPGLPYFWDCYLMLPHFLLSFPFLILFLLSWTHTSGRRTTGRNHSAHSCLAHHLACCLALLQSPVGLCTGAVILLTWFCNGAYLFLVFTQRDEWLLYLQVWKCLSQAVTVRQMTPFSLGLLLCHCRAAGFCQWEQDTVTFQNILGCFSNFHMITPKLNISTNI